MIRLLIADEHPVVRQGLRSFLSHITDVEVAAEVDNSSDMIEAAFLYHPDIILLDLCLKRHQIAETVETIRRGGSHARFLIFTTFRGPDEVALAFRAKMEGYALKTDAPAEILEAIYAINQGERWLSPHLVLQPGEGANTSLTEREREVLSVIARGKSNQEAAAALFISEGTVKFHVNNILNKLGADDRTSAVVIALHRGLLRLAEQP